jgi:uncharacterized YccA/Bax inhibitor family protein
MMTSTTPIFVVSSLACLVLAFYAFRSDADAAGHGPKQKLQMAAIWAGLIAGLTLLIGLFQP